MCGTDGEFFDNPKVFHILLNTAVCNDRIDARNRQFNAFRCFVPANRMPRSQRISELINRFLGFARPSEPLFSEIPSPAGRLQFIRPKPANEDGISLVPRGRFEKRCIKTTPDVDETDPLQVLDVQ